VLPHTLLLFIPCRDHIAHSLSLRTKGDRELLIVQFHQLCHESSPPAPLPPFIRRQQQQQHNTTHLTNLQQPSTHRVLIAHSAADTHKNNPSSSPKNPKNKATMSDQVTQIAEIPKEFFKEGSQFINRCTKRMLYWFSSVYRPLYLSSR